MKIAILYYSKSGHTLNAAKAIEEGIKEAGFEATIINVRNLEPPILKTFDKVIVGSPCWGGCVLNNAVASPVSKALKKLPANSLKGKTCGAFSVFAVKGGDKTVKTLTDTLTSKGAEKCIPGPVVKAGVPFSVAKGPSITKEDLEALKQYGKDFVK